MKLCNDSILLKLDPETNLLASGLYKPETAHDHIYRTGVVVDVGPGKWIKNTSYREPIPVKAGDGVVFIKFLTKTQTAQGVQDVIGSDMALCKPEDILLVYDHDNPPEISQ